jgi:monoamine oxidase
MAARELGRAGKRVTMLEARHRCGGRIYPLPAADFGYPAEGGAEFVHGEAPVTRSLLREAGISLLPLRGTRWNVEHGSFSPNEAPVAGTDRLHNALAELKEDLPIAEFLKRTVGGPEYSRLRQSIRRIVEGYDAADPERASTLALRQIDAKDRSQPWWCGFTASHIGGIGSARPADMAKYVSSNETKRFTLF